MSLVTSPRLRCAQGAEGLLLTEGLAGVVLRSLIARFAERVPLEALLRRLVPLLWCFVAALLGSLVARRLGSVRSALRGVLAEARLGTRLCLLPLRLRASVDRALEGSLLLEVCVAGTGLLLALHEHEGADDNRRKDKEKNNNDHDIEYLRLL